MSSSLIFYICVANSTVFFFFFQLKLENALKAFDLLLMESSFFFIQYSHISLSVVFRKITYDNIKYNLN